MCRVFGAAAAAPVSVSHELLRSENPLIRQSEDHDSGWGMAVYDNLPCSDPRVERFAQAAHTDPRFAEATESRGRIFNVHVRRATLGGIRPENTHPFDFGPYTFSHNGTILDYRALMRPGMPEPRGDTDSEHYFLRLLHDYDPADPVRSLRGVVAAIVAGSVFSGLNFVFSDGVRLYAYRLGIFTLHWTSREGIGMVASERLTLDRWHTVDQDVLLVFDPDQPEEPSVQRLIGDAMLEQARIEKLEPPAGMKGRERDEFVTLRAEIVRKKSQGGARRRPLRPDDLPLTPA